MQHLKTLLRRTCAVVLTLVMCLGSASAAITNSGTVEIVKNSFYSLSYSRCHREYAYGIGGKAADDEVVKVIANDDLSETNWYVYTTWSNPNNANYLVLEANLFLDEACTGFSFGTNTHSTMSPTINTNGLARAGQWGKVVLIYDTAEGTTDTYYNNRLISADYSTTFNTRVNGSLYSHIRLILYGSEPGTVTYADDFQLYETDVAPVITDTLYVTDHEDESHLTVLEGQKFGDLFQPSIPEAEIIIYKNSSYTKTQDIDEPLEDGNKIVLKHGDEYRTYTVEIDDGISLEDYNDDGTMELAKATAYTEMGVYGKAADDVSLKVVADSSLPCFTTYTWLNDTFSGHIMAEFNIMPGTMNSIYIGTNVHMPVSEPLILNARRWNRVTVVYDTNDFDPDTGIGKATTYVNGIEYCEIDTVFTHLTQLRVIMTGSAGSYAYIDDFVFEHHAYKSPEIPVAGILADDIEIVNGNIIPAEGMTVADVLPADPDNTIRVFTDSFCNIELSSNAALSFGNVVVVENERMMYNYYTVYGSDDINILKTVSDVSNDFAFTQGSVTTAYGLAGKDETDPSFKVAVNSDASNCFNDYIWTNNSFEGYLVTEFNVLPGTASISVVTDANAAYSAPITNAVPYRWNKVAVVLDGASIDAATGKYTTYTYVNGVLAGTATTGAKSGSSIRLLVSGSAGSYLHLDDYRVYETATVPMITVPDLSSSYQIVGDRIIFSSSTTPEQLTVDRLVIKAYTDRSCTTQITNTAIADGNVVVVRDSRNTYTYYTAGDKPVKTYLVQKNGDPMPKEYGFIDATYTTENAVYGRGADDASYKMVVASTASSYNGYFHYSYANQGHDRYVAAEASIYFPEEYNFDSFMMCTNGHHPLTNQIQIGSDSLPKEQWNRVVYLFDKQEQKSSLYINGILCDEKTVTYFPETRNSIRFVTYADQESVVYFDDLVIYESDLVPPVTKAAVMPSSTRYILYGATLYASQNTSVRNIQSWVESETETSVRFLRDGQIVEVSGSDYIPDNSTLVIQTSDGQFTSYDISVTEYNNTVMYGSANGDGVLKDGELNIAVPVSNMFNPPDVGIATYKDGKLISIQKAEHNGYPYQFVQHQLTVDTNTTDTIKVFVWDNYNFAPLAKNGFITIAE